MWYNCTVTAMRKLRISYNNSLPRILNISKHNSASELFVNLNFKSLGELLKKTFTGLWTDYSVERIYYCLPYVKAQYLCTLILDPVGLIS